MGERERTVHPAIRSLIVGLPAALAAIAIFGPVMFAQSFVPFGPLLMIDLPEPFDRGISLDEIAGDSIFVLLWNTTTHRLAIASADTGLTHWNVRPLTVNFSFDDVLYASIDVGTLPALIFPDRSARIIRIVKDWTSADSLVADKSLALDRIPTLVLASDIDRDGRGDLLVLDTGEPGILPVLNRGGGVWQKASLIARELPIRAMALTHLNNDVMVDLIAVDWVRSELHTLYGVGKGRFLDQGIFPVEAAVDRIVLDPAEGEHPLRAFLLQYSPALVESWEMDEQGDFHLREKFSIEKGIVDVSVLQKTGEATEFAVLSSQSALRLYTFGHRPLPADLIEFGVPFEPVGMVRMRGVGLITLSHGMKSAVMYRRETDASALTDSVSYAVGRWPTGIDTVDANGDTLVDLVVANQKSSTVSFLLGKGDGIFSGQIPFDIPGGPTGILAGTSGDTVARIYATHPSPQILSVSEIDVAHQSLTSSEIPTPGIPDLLSEIHGGSNTIMVAALNISSGAGSVLSLYERLKAETFLERTFRLAPPSILVGATMTLFDADDVPDIVFAYKPDDSSDVTIGVAYGDSAFVLRRRKAIQDIPVRDVRRAYVWSADLNGDGFKDLVVAFPRTSQQVFTLQAKSDSTFDGPRIVDSLVRLEEFAQFRVVDVDGDGLPDLVASLPQRGGVGWWHNLGGTFAPWRFLAGSTDISGFVVCDLNRDGVADIAVTHPRGGFITIHSGRTFEWGVRHP
ncbi:MAG: hypothetical protein A3H45_08450 [Ignavibacteria bacterium RIFCSPLOWO2_02_FULL_55_14]|nr:MAG: hypothetical protein A3H45_08450 [Ignavibacteria bacterium RIFCSPLOWO2_02_FULL_55_14]